MKNILVYNHDIQKYPPILSAIKILLSQGEEIVILGYCSDNNTIKLLEEQGVVYYETIINNTKDNKITKFLRLISYRKKIEKIVALEHNENSLLWIYGNQNIWLLHKLVLKVKSILYLFETPQLKVSLRYKILSPFIDYSKTMQSAWKVVCCEYNRAHITKSFFDLPKIPLVIPNKPDFDLQLLKELDANIASNFKNKKVILYQGIFNYPERRLDELCESVQYLPSEYIICIMGDGDINKARLKEKYESERVIFLPFISAPYHLEITKIAYVGFLTYFSKEGSIENSLNTLYCAPNKVFEYSCFGIPMLSNDVPSLAHIFDKYNCGKVADVFEPKELAKKILEIDEDYKSFQQGAVDFYNSVNVQELIKQLIS